MPCAATVIKRAEIDRDDLSQPKNFMKKEIIKIAEKKLRILSKQYDRFVNVVVDDWRGYRFIFDTEDVRNCKNNCSQCGLYKLLKNEKDDYFSAGLILAADSDKIIFGSQNYLNCKTLEQYQRCYLNFIKTIKTKEELEDELNLVKNLKIIYSKEGKKNIIEKRFKEAVMGNSKS